MSIVQWLRDLVDDLRDGTPPWHPDLDGAHERHTRAVQNFSEASERSLLSSDHLKSRAVRTRIVAEGVLRRVGGPH